MSLVLCPWAHVQYMGLWTWSYVHGPMFKICPLSYFHGPMSNVQCPLSMVLCPWSYVLGPTSIVLFPLSDVHGPQSYMFSVIYVLSHVSPSLYTIDKSSSATHGWNRVNEITVCQFSKRERKTFDEFKGANELPGGIV